LAGLASGTNVVFTVIELSGLLVVVAAGLAAVFGSGAGDPRPAVEVGMGGGEIVVALALTLSGTLESLAATTSLLILAVFFTVDLALVWIKLGRARGEGAGTEAGEAGVFRVPVVVPLLGMGCALALVPFGPLDSALTAAGVVAAGAVLLLVRRRSGFGAES